MKGIKIALIAILTGLVVVLGSILFMGLNGNSFWLPLFNNGTQGDGNIFSWSFSRDICTLQNTTSIDPENITDVKINYKNTPFDIIFLSANDDKITINEYFNKEVETEKLAKIEQKGALLSISQQFAHTLNWNRTYGYIEILIPEAVYNSLKILDVATTSGDIEMTQLTSKEAANNVSIKSIYLVTASGDITADYIKAEETSICSTSGYITLGYNKGTTLSVATTSGDIAISELEYKKSNVISTSGYIDVKKAECSENKISSTSGDISIDTLNGDLVLNTTSGYLKIGTINGNLNTNGISGDQEIQSITGNLDMSSTSGYLTVYELVGKGKFSTVSGDIKVSATKWMGGIEAGTTSGEVYLTLPKDSSFLFDANSMSGTISTYFDDELQFNKRQTSAFGTIGTQAAQHPITITTTSGDITIR